MKKMKPEKQRERQRCREKRGSGARWNSTRCLRSEMTLLHPSIITSLIMPHLTEHYRCIMGSEGGGRGDAELH